MALYTLMNRDDVFRNVGPTPQETELYNTIGRTAGSTQNSGPAGLFEKRAKSIENAIGTTLAAPVSFINDAIQNAKTDSLLKDNNQRMDDVYRQFGFNGREDYDRQLEATAEGSAEEQRLLNIPGLQEALQAQAKSNADKVEQNAREYKDYAENDYISQKINQDRGKFAGSAINTLSTATDVLGLTNGPVSNAIQGGIEGLADELEENGFQNFDANRALKNAATGAVTGAAVGKLNQGVNKMLQPNGNLFKGGNALTRTINDLGSKTALGRLGSTVATGAARGALSGAVGGATGAGLQSAMNGVELGQGIANTLQGAGQGAVSGAMTGAAMAGINSAINKTPFMQQVNQAKQDWQNSGKTFDERLTNTFTSGDSAVGDWLMNKRQSKLLNSVGNVGNSIREFTEQGLGPRKAEQEAYKKLMSGYNEEGIEGIIANAESAGMPGETNFQKARRLVEGGDFGISYQDAFDDLRSIYGDDFNPDTYLTKTGDWKYKDGEPYVWTIYKNKLAMALSHEMDARQTPTTAAGWVKKAGERIVEDANNRGVGLSLKDTSKDIEANVTEPSQQETELYRTLSGEPDQEEVAAYGESGLATGKTKKQNLLSKAGRAMQASQVNATRKETRDIGIENSGELVNRLRKRTGFTDIEDQAAFGRELTGGEKSLLDEIQSNAIAATEDGSVRTVEIDKLIPQINKLIDDTPNTLVNPSKKAEVKENVLADLTNGGIDTIHKANNFKAAAKQQFLINERTPNDSAKELGKLYTKIGDLVDEASYAEVPQSQVEIMFETAAKEAHIRAQNASKNGKEDIATAYNNLENELNASPKTIQAYRSLKKDYVDINKLSRKTQQGATAWNNPLTMGTAVTAAMMTGNPLVAVPAAWAAKTFAPAIGEAAIKTSAKVGGKIADFGDKISTKMVGVGNTNPGLDVNSNPSTQIYNTIGRTAGQVQDENVANYLVTAVNEQNATPNTLEGLASGNTTTASPTSVYSTVNGTQAQGKSYFQPTGDYWTDLIGRAMSLAMDADDAQSFGTLYGMYQDAVSKLSSNTSSDTKLTDKQRQANAAARALEDFENEEHNFAYDLSGIPGIGTIANLGGNNYKSKAEALALQIGYMLSGATVNKDEAKKIGESYVPQPMDNEVVRKNKLTQLRGIISEYQRS